VVVIFGIGGCLGSLLADRGKREPLTDRRLFPERVFGYNTKKAETEILDSGEIRTDERYAERAIF
jgi:hypothetical protein